MHTRTEWETIAKAFDFVDLPYPHMGVRRCISWERTASGITCLCSTIDSHQVHISLQAVSAEIFRVRMHPQEIPEKPSDMLSGPVPEYRDITIETAAGEQGELIRISTGRVTASISTYPWRITIADTGSEDDPFFAQSISDRSYGPFYETAPMGYDQPFNGRLCARDAMEAAPDERFYGLGEGFTRIDRWGQSITIWSIDAGSVNAYRSYKAMPFLMSSRGYGLLLHTSFPSAFKVCSESGSTCTFETADELMDYFVIRGKTHAGTLRMYAQLTGFAPVPPKWSFGLWLSRCSFLSRDEVEQAAQGMRDHQIPCDVISIDPWWQGDSPWCSYTWDSTRFPDHTGMMKNLREMGMRTCLWITPYVPVDTPLFEEGESKGYFIRDKEGAAAEIIEAFAGEAFGGIDFTDEQQVQWFTSKLEVLLDEGVSVFKTDFGEQAPVDAVYHDGRSGLEMHNLYPLLYNKAVFELVERKHGRGVTWGRSGYIGSQRYPLQWGGDSYASFSQMHGQLRGLLSYGLSGVPFCGHDIGGFDYEPERFDLITEGVFGAKERLQTTRSEEDAPSLAPDNLRHTEADPVIYIRWMQFGVFSSHARLHGKRLKEPWEYGEQALKISRRYISLRYQLLPYIYTQAVISSQTALPMVRPMVLEFQDDPTVHQLESQYLFGSDLLAAPVFNRHGNARVYFPAGSWCDFWTDEVITGPCWRDITADINTFPLWIREGAVIPMGPVMQHAEEKPLESLKLVCFMPKDAHRSVIYDEQDGKVTEAAYVSVDKRTLSVSGTVSEVTIELRGEGRTVALPASGTLDL